jgi:hypothetical protein
MRFLSHFWLEKRMDIAYMPYVLWQKASNTDYAKTRLRVQHFSSTAFTRKTCPRVLTRS